MPVIVEQASIGTILEIFLGVKDRNRNAIPTKELQELMNREIELEIGLLYRGREIDYPGYKRQKLERSHNSFSIDTDDWGNLILKFNIPVDFPECEELKTPNTLKRWLCNVGASVDASVKVKTDGFAIWLGDCKVAEGDLKRCITITPGLIVSIISKTSYLSIK